MAIRHLGSVRDEKKKAPEGALKVCGPCIGGCGEAGRYERVTQVRRVGFSLAGDLPHPQWAGRSEASAFECAPNSPITPGSGVERPRFRVSPTFRLLLPTRARSAALLTPP